VFTESPRSIARNIVTSLVYIENSGASCLLESRSIISKRIPPVYDILISSDYKFYRLRYILETKTFDSLYVVK
jgi:hypothetical protein